MDLKTVNKVVLRGMEYPLPTKIEIDLDSLKDRSIYTPGPELALDLLWIALNKYQTEVEQRAENE